MANISYDILYTPVLPLQQEPFEYLDGTGKFKIRFDISVGNSVEDFNSGFIRIKNSKTENNVLIKDYNEQVIPFTNSLFGSKKDLIKKEKINIPIVQKDKDGYYIELNKDIVGKNLLSSKTDIKDNIINQNLSVQISLTKDVVNAGIYSDMTDSYIPNIDGTGTGILLIYNDEDKKWEKLVFSNYFNGDILARGVSSWSAVSTLNILSTTKYSLVHPETENILSSINSPITEFYGIKNENSPVDNIGLKLKKFKIQIFDNELETTPLIEDSGWIKSNGVNDLQIIWQNSRELVDKHNYLVRLKICNYFNFYKDFDYKLKTIFQKSDFKGELKVTPNYDLAKNEIELKIKSPIVWGPSENIDISDDGFIDVNDEGITIDSGINLTPNNGDWSGDFIFSGINPIDNWEEDGNDFFLRIQNGEPTLKHPYQYIYTVHALSTPTSFDVNYGKEKSDFSPYEDDIIWNPVITSHDDIYSKYQLFLDSSDDLYDSDDIDNIKNNRVLTLGLSKTKKYPTLDVLYVREYDRINECFIDKWWEILIDKNGDVKIQEASFGVGIDFTPKPIYLYDPIKHLITEMGVTIKSIDNNIDDTDNYRLYFDDKIRNFIPGRSKRPTYINEFRLVKRIYSIISGTKTEISKQTYRAYLTGPNQKLMDWKIIAPDRKYYLQISERKGKIQLNVADITDKGKEMLDRYNAQNNGASMGLLSNQILTMRGLDGNSYMVERLSDGRQKYFNLSVDAIGIPNVDYGNLSAITITYEPLLNKDIGMDNIQNGSKNKDDFIDFDEIVADVVVDGEEIKNDYKFIAIDENRKYYKQPLIDFANILREERKNNNAIFLFATDQHYAKNRYDNRKNVVSLYEKQYDSIDCMVELSHMVDIDAILLGGDNIDGCTRLFDAKKSLQFLIDKLNKKSDNTDILITKGNHDSNTVGVIAGNLAHTGKKTIDIQEFNSNVFFDRKEYISMCSMPKNIWFESGCGFMIKNGILYISVDSSDTKTIFNSKNEIVFDPLEYHGYSTNQLNQISQILQKYGNQVDSIIVISHIPSNTVSSEDKVGSGNLNIEMYNRLLSDYNNGKINIYGDDEDSVNDDQAIVLSTTTIDDSYAKISLCLHGHKHYDKLDVINDIPHLQCCSALNAKTNKEYGWIERISDNTSKKTSFKAIIWNKNNHNYKILNFGYTSKNTINNKIIEGGK